MPIQGNLYIRETEPVKQIENLPAKPKTKLKKKIQPSKKMMCAECKIEQPITNFYNTNSLISNGGKSTMCKNCMQRKIDYNNIQTLFETWGNYSKTLSLLLSHHSY